MGFEIDTNKLKALLKNLDILIHDTYKKYGTTGYYKLFFVIEKLKFNMYI